MPATHEPSAGLRIPPLWRGACHPAIQPVMRRAPPVLPGGSALAAESPIDRALALGLAEEREAALRWAAAVVKSDLAMPTALATCGRLLGELGRQEIAREACTVAITRAIDLENLPLAVAAAR